MLVLTTQPACYPMCSTVFRSGGTGPVGQAMVGPTLSCVYMYLPYCTHSMKGWGAILYTKYERIGYGRTNQKLLPSVLVLHTYLYPSYASYTCRCG